MRSIVCLCAFALIGCSGTGSDPWAGKPGPKVLVTFAPLQSFAANVAGPDATVVSMLTNNGPHGFEPTAAEGRLVAKADLLFFNGLELDDGIVERLGKSRGEKLRLVNLGEILDKRTLIKMAEHDHDHAAHAGHEHHHHGEMDPHVWLGIPQAVAMTKHIAAVLGEADPAHKDAYEKRASEYVAKLEKLQADGKELLKGKTEKSFVTFHESLAYFADSYGLKVAGVVQVDPGVEPSLGQMNKLIELCKTEKVRLIAVEPQFPANTAARSVLEAIRKTPGLEDAAFVEVDPLETGDPTELSADWYESKMRENLGNLAKALK